MTSLFARILFWFLLATTASSVVVILASQWFAQPTLLNVVAGGLLSASLEQARDAYEREGRDGLQRFATSFERGFNRTVRVTDGEGRDLLTGEAVTRQSAAAPRVDRALIAFSGGAMMLTRRTSDGRYRIYVPLGGNGPRPGWRRP